MKNKQFLFIVELIATMVFSCAMFLFGWSFAGYGMGKITINEIIMLILFFLFVLVFVFLLLKLIFQTIKNKKDMLDANQTYIDLIANIQGGVITCIFDVKSSSSKILYINEGWTKITGYTLDEINNEKGGNPQAIVLAKDREKSDKQYIEQTSRGNSYELQYRVVRKDGSVVWVIDKGIVTIQTSRNVQNQSIITEVTEIKEKEEHLRMLSQTDPLTRLSNKVESTLLVQRVLDTQKNQLHALMVFDIDDFKGINDSYGHIFGDTVLIEVSEHIKRLFGSQDIIGRIGGDEFLVFMSNISSRDIVEKKANEVCAAFRSIAIDDVKDHKISCSIGIAFFTDEKEFKSLFNKADIALYKAKTKGKDNFLVYNDNDHSCNL